jgi:hypothetical protein
VQRGRILASVPTTFFNGIGHFLCLSIDINKSTRRDGNHSPRSILDVFGFFFFFFTLGDISVKEISYSYFL